MCQIKPATISQTLNRISALFETAGSSHPLLDARQLVAHILGKELAFLLSHPDEIIPAELLRRLGALVQRRTAGEPLQYILGFRYFWKDSFTVDASVLIPRPETELLVEWGARLMADVRRPLILDLATGSGCVGLSLLGELSLGRVVATDISAEALKLARLNSRALGRDTRFHLVQCDGPASFPQIPEGLFHLVVSNPPYVSLDEYHHLDDEVRLWEPSSALVAADEGLAYYKLWLDPCLRLLRNGGHLLMEFGFGQQPHLLELAEEQGFPVNFISDLAHIPRVLHIHKT